MRFAIIACALVFAGCSSSSEVTSTDTGTSPTDTATTDTVTSGCSATDFGGPCNPLCATDTGCSDDELCTLNGTVTQCVAAGTQTLGKGCNAETTCAAGACVTAEIGGSKCRAFCSTDADCDAADQCNPLEGVDGIGACTPRPAACSVYDQNCEDAAKACYLDGCLDPGEVALGDECNATTRCVKGLVCSDGALDTMRCHEVCNPNTGGPDPKCHLKCPGDFATLIDADGKSTGVGVCQQDDMEDDCDLLGQNCDATQACYWTGNGPRCRDAGATPIGTTCSDETECVKGAVCWPIGTKCRAVCTPGAGLHPECEDSTTKCPALTQNAGYCDE
ncbi:MAG: hypothetical protein ACI9OJ_000163 [Myxococcota bacterium]|jgi:hypothetical protein